MRLRTGKTRAGHCRWPRAADVIQCPVPRGLRKIRRAGGQVQQGWAAESGLPFLSVFLFSAAVNLHGTRLPRPYTSLWAVDERPLEVQVLYQSDPPPSQKKRARPLVHVSHPLVVDGTGPLLTGCTVSIMTDQQSKPRRGVVESRAHRRGDRQKTWLWQEAPAVEVAMAAVASSGHLAQKTGRIPYCYGKRKTHAK